MRKSKSLKVLIASAILASGVLMTSPSTLAAKQFTDLNINTSHAEAVQYLNSVDAYDYKVGNKFNGNAHVTRVEVAQLLHTIFADELEATREYSNSKFKDVTSATSGADAIIWSYEVGIFDGGADGKFNPTAKLTRAQMSKILVNTFNLTATKSVNFKDISSDHWAYDYISVLAANGITNGDGKGSYLPNNNVTLDQLSSFVYRVMKNFGEVEPLKTETVQPVKQEEPATTIIDDQVEEESVAEENSTQSNDELFAGYKLIEADVCSTSGYREAKVVVDIGYGEREYWAFTNEYGQLVRVIADEIVLQDDNNESVTSSGRYCNDEAKVPGVESSTLDEGHIIADSLGGVSNAYNITPQDSTLNRHGDQAYMEEVIRKAGGAANFEAIITYADTNTQIPSSYKYTYTVNGNEVVDTFDNTNPDKVNESMGLTTTKPATQPSTNNTSSGTSSNNTGDLASVDKNGNGKVTIQEAKDAGYSMPITRDHWLYQYMDDRDGDGMVGE